MATRVRTCAVSHSGRHALTHMQCSSCLSDQMRILFSRSRESCLNISAIKPLRSQGRSFPVLFVPIFVLTQHGALTLGNESIHIKPDLSLRFLRCRILFPTHYMARYTGNDMLFERFVHIKMQVLLVGSRICILECRKQLTM